VLSSEAAVLAMREAFREALTQLRAAIEVA
jgi:hypothetical protein